MDKLYQIEISSMQRMPVFDVYTDLHKAVAYMRVQLHIWLENKANGIQERDRGAEALREWAVRHLEEGDNWFSYAAVMEGELVYFTLRYKEVSAVDFRCVVDDMYAR